jgi:ATP-dependent Lon protease
VDLEWIVRLALEARRRVKEQQRRVFKSEFRNTHFSYTLGPEGVETFVATPELQSDQAIESDPLPPGQIWAIAPGSSEAGAGLFRIEVSHQPGSGVRILNQPAPPAFRESVKVGEQILFAQARSLVGDRDPRAQEFTLQLRAIDADRSGGGLGVAVLTALCILVGSATLGGSIELVPNAVQIAELAVEKQAQTLLMPVSARRQLNELPDDFWTKVNIEFYRDTQDAVFKALEE